MSDDKFKFDKTPPWLQKLINESKGRDLSKYGVLDSMFYNEEVIKSDRFDRKLYKDIREKANGLNEIAMSKFDTDPSWFDLIKDDYLGLYKALPQKNKPHEMKPTHRINHEVMSKAMSTREWEELRTYTELDEWASVMAAVEFATRLDEMFDEHKELQEARSDLQDKQDDVQEFLNKLEEQRNNVTEEDLDDLEDKLEDLQEAMDEADQSFQAVGGSVRKKLRESIQESKDAIQQMEEAIQSFGTDPGELKRMDSQQRLELAARIQRNRNLKEMAEKIGRMVRLALGEQARKIIHGHDEVHDIEQGNDISRLLASELSLLSNEEAKLLFLKKFAERELLQYQLRGTEKAARGAIVCMIDSSGSMSGAPDTWARAVAIALLNIAAKQNRDFYAIIFSSAHDPLKEWYFKRGIASINDVIDFAEFSYHGGTDFQKPISRGVEILSHQFAEAGATKGDLMMITDGHCAVTEEWLDRYRNSKKDLGFRMYSALIGASSPTLDEISDLIYNITDLARGGEIKEVFGYV